MSSPLVLSLFPGIGLLDMAFEEEGFCVVRGPDPLWGGDVRRFHVPDGRFDGVIGGPPCQRWSTMRHLIKHKGNKLADDLIPEYCRCVDEARPTWFVMENVKDAPLPKVTGYFVHEQFLRDVWVGGSTMRLRRISFGSGAGARLEIDQLALHAQDVQVAALASGGDRIRPVAIGGSGRVKKGLTTHAGGPRSVLERTGKSSDLREILSQQGLPADFLADAPFNIPGKRKMIGNGVPLPMGRAIARAVKRAMYPELVEAA